MSSANNHQVAGQHYQSPYQHWDLVIVLNLGYFEGQITKYLTRHARKNGLEDVMKAAHFLDKLIEEVESGNVQPPFVTKARWWQKTWWILTEQWAFGGQAWRENELDRYAAGNSLSWDSPAFQALCCAAAWETLAELHTARELVKSALAEYAEAGAAPTRAYIAQ